jgi:type I restriction enzyme S subunit
MMTANLNVDDSSLKEQATGAGLPEGWETVALQQLVSHKKGKKPKKLGADKWQGTVPYIDIEAFETGHIRRYADPETSVLVDEGDVVVVWDGARCGHAGRVPVHGALGSTLMNIQPISINPNYVLHFLQMAYETINSNPRGTGIPHVEPQLFWNLELPLAPLPEQKRIVAKVEELLARVNVVRERLAGVKGILKRFRQSVLAAACSGRLTADWREGREFDNEWLELRLADIGIVTGGITKNSKRDNFELRVPYLRVANVYENELRLDDVALIGVTQAEFERTLLKRGDLLFVEGNGSIEQIGRVALWDNSIQPCVHQNHLIKFRPSEKIVPPYALFWMMSSLGRASLSEAAVSTAGLYNLSISKIENLPIRVPCFEEQAEIVRRIKALFNSADGIEKRVGVAGERAKGLRQAILAKAFRGELVPTEAELAQQEGRSYESASTLLAKIKTQRS